MKREGSNGKLSAAQLIFILVLFLGSYIDDINGASVLPTISGTPSMSVSLSVSYTQTQSLSQSNSYSGSVPVSISGTVTTGLTPTATAASTATATVGTSGSGTVTTGLTPTATAAATPSSSLSVGASPYPSGAPSFAPGVPAKQVAKYFCGNTFKETAFTEKCDFGAANIPKYTCCTPSCHWAHAPRKCQTRYNGCFKEGRCTGYSTCRDSTPKPFGVGCNRNQGFCDGKGNCLSISQYYLYTRHFRSRRHGKNKLLKKFLKSKKKFTNFDLTDVKKEQISLDANLTHAILNYDPDMEDGYLEELEQIIQMEKRNSDLDYDPLDEFDS